MEISGTVHVNIVFAEGKWKRVSGVSEPGGSAARPGPPCSPCLHRVPNPGLIAGELKRKLRVLPWKPYFRPWGVMMGQCDGQWHPSLATWTSRLRLVALCMLFCVGRSAAQARIATPWSAPNEGLRTTTSGWMEIADNMVSGSNIQNSGCLR